MNELVKGAEPLREFFQRLATVEASERVAVIQWAAEGEDKIAQLRFDRAYYAVTRSGERFPLGKGSVRTLMKTSLDGKTGDQFRSEFVTVGRQRFMQLSVKGHPLKPLIEDCIVSRADWKRICEERKGEVEPDASASDDAPPKQQYLIADDEQDF